MTHRLLRAAIRSAPNMMLQFYQQDCTSRKNSYWLHCLCLCGINWSNLGHRKGLPTSLLIHPSHCYHVTRNDHQLITHLVLSWRQLPQWKVTKENICCRKAGEILFPHTDTVGTCRVWDCRVSDRLFYIGQSLSRSSLSAQRQCCFPVSPQLRFFCLCIPASGSPKLASEPHCKS